jgi:DNA-directed RNA polymerase specialized sigma24 family protein
MCGPTLRQQKAWDAWAIDKLTHEQIAAKFGITVSAVKQRIAGYRTAVYGRALSRGGREHKAVPMQLSLCNNS